MENGKLRCSLGSQFYIRAEGTPQLSIFNFQFAVYRGGRNSFASSRNFSFLGRDFKACSSPPNLPYIVEGFLCRTR